jgi:hypothetical protein
MQAAMRSSTLFFFSFSTLPIAFMFACGGKMDPSPTTSEESVNAIEPSPTATSTPTPTPTPTGSAQSVDPIDASPPPAFDAAWIRIDNEASPPFDVCFPLERSDPPDFTGALPAIGGAGIATGTITPYITVPSRTAYMRVVAAGGDCSTRIGGFPDDDLGPFSAGAGERFTVYFDTPYAFDRISTDP